MPSVRLNILPSMSLDTLEFRQFEQRDHGQVRALHEAALRATNAFAERGAWDSDLDDISANYIRKNGSFVVGMLADEVVAIGAFRELSPGVAELKRMRVRPDLQRNGVGRRLLTLLESQIVAAGYVAIQLDTTVNQSAARALYEQSGYVELRREIEGWPLETIFYRKLL
jgi:ribosomal protein S18 acetylase RimI-like enzyme